MGTEDSGAPGLFVLAILVVGGMATMGFSGYVLYDERQRTANAVEVDAVVLDSHVAEREDDDRSKTTYHPRVEYRYTYEGTEYTSERVFAGASPGFNEGAAGDIVAKYPEGETVTAHVNAEEPSEAFLETSGRNTFGMVIFSLLGFVMLVAGIDQTMKKAVGVSVLSKIRAAM